MSSTIAGPGEAALRALMPPQISFLERLPKAELHAHLNGSIPLPLLQDLAREYTPDDDAGGGGGGAETAAPDILASIQRLEQAGSELACIDDFFDLFPAIYALTSTPASLKRATRATLAHFLDPSSSSSYATSTSPAPAAAVYIELRTTPRETPHMSRRVYLETVLDEIEARSPDAAALIVSLDRRMTPDVAREVLELAVQLRREGRRVVGLDLCGNPKAGDMTVFSELFRAARTEGLGVTLHIAEGDSLAEETMELLSCEPERLGHASFLNEEAKEVVLKRRTCIEICLTSNLLCKTVQHIQDHHIRYYLARNHPIAICTDDILPFRNSIMGEYALLMAPNPVGLGLTENEIETVARMGMESRFPNILQP